jgi:predicted phage terminase large subunit-like protein
VDTTKYDPAEQAALGAILRTDLRAFTEKVFETLNPSTPYRDNWHIGAMSTILERVANGEQRRLISNVPPRHLKSTVTSVAFPAWVLGNQPHKRIICASYSMDLAVYHARATREIMCAPWYRAVFPALELDGKFTESEFHTTQHGSRLATSVGSTLTGLGGNIIVIDDPLKPADALSEAERKRVNDWLDATVSTRFDDPKTGAIIVVMQRLHEDDPAGHLLAKGGWSQLCIPAEAPQDLHYDVGGNDHLFQAGTVLDPVRMPKDVLDDYRSQMGTSAYAAQYLQEPVPAEGNLFHWEWIKFFDPQEIHAGEWPYIFQAWDVATTPSSRADYSVCTTWAAVEHDRFCLLDVLRVKLELPDLLHRAAAHFDRFQPDIVLVEAIGNGAGFYQTLRRDLGPHGLRVFADRPQIGKLARAEAVTPMLARGCMSVPSDAEWLENFRGEYKAFPAARHDDQVDSMVMFLTHAERLIYEANALGRVRKSTPRINPPRHQLQVTVRPIGPSRRRPLSGIDHAVREHFGRW